ncbi:hypothetical protein JCM10450v2_003936 [Rhodotorula kratochvilovae]
MQAMLLNLVPPSSLPIPPPFQSYAVPVPHLPPPDELRPPAAYTKARKALAAVGLVAPNLLAFDRALWWQLVVRSIEWNLEDEVVVVTLVDGSEERWNLGIDSDDRSEELVEDSLDAPATTDEAGAGETAQASGTSGSRSSPWAPMTVLARLHELCVELRSAYEDLGMAHAHDSLAPEISTADDWRMLQRLSAEPKLPVPFEWSDAQALYEYAMEGIDDEVASPKRNGEGQAGARAGRPSQTESAGSEVDDVHDPHKYRGQFKPRYRARCTKASLAASDARQPHDFLSTIHLLSRIRAYLADLVARTVVPKLRERLVPTYSLWAATSAIAWCRRNAVRRGGEVAQLLIELLDDDGEAFDADSASAHSQQDIIVDEADAALGFENPFAIVLPDLDLASGGGGLYEELAEWRAEEKRQQRLADNVLADMRDDFKLRCWCESALERARDLEQRDWAIEGGEPRWIAPLKAVEVSRASGHAESDADEPRAKGGFAIPRALQPRVTAECASPPTSPPPEGDEYLSSIRTRASLASSPTPPDSDEPTEDEDEGLRRGGAWRYAPEYFYPEDLVDEEFLPPRLPRTLVLPSAARGREMEEQRAKVHGLLNIINGLQVKIVELQDFVVEETQRWEQSLEEQCKVKDPPPPSSSGLRSVGASSTSPPPPEITAKIVPLKAQPLRKQAADKMLSAKLNFAMHALEPSEHARAQTVKRLKLPKVRLHSAAPRRRQKVNLETYGKLLAMTHAMFVDADDADERSKGKAKKRKRGKAPGVGPHVSEDGSGPRKRRRKGNPVRREGASADLGRSPGGSTQQSTSAAAVTGSSSPQDARRLTVFELSNRRREALAASRAGALAWAEDEDEEEGETADAISTEQVPLMSSTLTPYEDEPDTDDEDDGVDFEEVEIDVSEEEEDHDTDTLMPPIPSSFDMRPETPFQDVYEAPTRPPSVAAPSSSPSPAPQRSRLPSLVNAFPTSAERSALAGPSSSAFLPSSMMAPAPATPSPSFLLAPNPLRPFALRAPAALPPIPPSTTSSPPAPHPATSSSSPLPQRPSTPSPPSGPSAGVGLAQRARERLACLAEPPVRLGSAGPHGTMEPPLSLDWRVATEESMPSGRSQA